MVIARLHFNAECGVNKLFSSFLENSWITRNTFFRIADAQDIEINNQPTIKSYTVMRSNKCQHKVIYQRHACNPYVNHVCHFVYVHVRPCPESRAIAPARVALGQIVSARVFHHSHKILVAC